MNNLYVEKPLEIAEQHVDRVWITLWRAVENQPFRVEDLPQPVDSHVEEKIGLYKALRTN